MHTATNPLLCNMTVMLLWKCNKLIVTQQELLHYYSNADLTCHNIYIYETILFVREKGNCKRSYRVHSHNTKSLLNYRQSAHNLEIYNCRPTIAGGRFYNRLPAHIKLIKDDTSILEDSLSSCLLKAAIIQLRNICGMILLKY
jgi:hypothetical protein